MVTLVVAFLIAFTAAPAFADSGTFTSNDGLNLTGGATQAGPSTATVAGLAGGLDNATVTLSNVSGSSSDSDILLVSPHGETVLLEGHVPFTTSGATWTYSDGAPSQTDGSSNTYSPTPGISNSDTFDAPAPTGPTYGASMSSLYDQDPNGTWQLFVHDNQGKDVSVGSWSLDLQTTPSVDPAAKDFGGMPVGSTSPAQTFTVSYAGEMPLNIGTTPIQGANASDFTIGTNTCQNQTLGIASCTISVAFTPSAPGARSATLVINDDSPGPTHTIPLSGTGLGPALTLSSRSLDFGSRLIGSPGDLQTVTLTNSGTDTLVFSGAPSLAGDDAGQFTLSDSSCVSGLAPGASCSLKVGFSPSVEGPRGAAVVIQDNAPGSPQSVSVAGIAVKPIPSPPAPTPQESGSKNITIENASFSNAPMVGQETALDIAASDPKQSISGLIVDFGEKLGLFGESACVVGSNKGNHAAFHVPYAFLTPGDHTIKVTVFAGGCGSGVAHTYVFTVSVAPASTARRVVGQAALTETTLTGPDITSKCKDATLVPSPKNGKRIMKALLCVMNEQRALARLKPLKSSKQLTKAALTHTKNMISGKFFAHQGPKEPALVTRFKKVKYRKAGGENIGAGAGSLASPLQMVNGWMHSSLHRANLLSKKWKTVGIGLLPKFPIPPAITPAATYTTDFGVK